MWPYLWWQKRWSWAGRSRWVAGSGGTFGWLRVAAAFTAVAGSALVLAGFATRTGLAVLTESESIAANAFDTDTFGVTLHLHNYPTPPTGATASQTVLPLDTTAPTASALYNYDTNRDSFAGLLIAKGGSGPSESDTTKHQAWRTQALTWSRTIDGTVDVYLSSGIKDFGQGKTGSVTIYLRDFDGASYTEICNGVLTQAGWQGGSSTWVLKTFSFNCSSYTIPASHMLELKLIVNSSSEDDMWFAYDTTGHDSRVGLP